MSAKSLSFCLHFNITTFEAEFHTHDAPRPPHNPTRIHHIRQSPRPSTTYSFLITIYNAISVRLKVFTLVPFLTGNDASSGLLQTEQYTSTRLHLGVSSTHSLRAKTVSSVHNGASSVTLRPRAGSHNQTHYSVRVSRLY